MYSVVYDRDVASLTTFGISARTAAVAIYHDVDDLRELLADKSLPRPLKHIGQGSNLLFVGEFTGTLILCDNDEARVTMVSNGKMYITAAAGVIMDSLIAYCAQQDFWGLENLSGIPGTVGAAVVQNVGAYGVEAADRVASATLIDVETGQTVTMGVDEMKMGYRDSIFKHQPAKSRYMVVDVTFELSTDPAPVLDYANLRERLFSVIDPDALTAADVRAAIIEMRDSKLPDPTKTGSAGSFFKNPVVGADTFARLAADNPDVDFREHRQADGSVKIPAARLLELTGAKDRRCGGAAVWHKQPLVIVNTGNATGRDVLRLEEELVRGVYERFGITLTPEVEHIG